MPSTQPATTENSNDQPEQPWAEPMPSESPQWFQRFSLYAGLGAARSIRAVYNAELAQRGKPSEHSKPVPSSWTQAARRCEWQRRAEAFDAWRRAQVFSSGNAQDTERIKKLDVLAERMHSRIVDEIDSMPVNDKYIAAYMSIMDMLAKLTGGYAPQRLEHTGKDGGKIEVEETQVKVVFYVPEVDQVEISDSADLREVGEVSGSEKQEGQE